MFRSFAAFGLLAIATPAFATDVQLVNPGTSITVEAGEPVALEILAAEPTDVQFYATVRTMVNGSVQTDTRLCGVTSTMQFGCVGVGTAPLNEVNGFPGVYGVNVAAMSSTLVDITMPTSLSDIFHWWWITCNVTEEEYNDCDNACAPKDPLIEAAWYQHPITNKWYCVEHCECVPPIQP